VKLQASHIVFLIVGVVAGLLLSGLFHPCAEKGVTPSKEQAAAGAPVASEEPTMASTQAPNVLSGQEEADSAAIAPGGEAAVKPEGTRPKRNQPTAKADVRKAAAEKLAKAIADAKAGDTGEAPAEAGPRAALRKARPGTESAPEATPEASENVDPNAPHPKIWVENTTYDAGLISNSEPTVRKIPVFNKGTALLDISSVKASCGCVAAKIDKTQVPPNESTELVVTMDPKRIGGFSSSKSITIYSNDIETPQLRMTVTCEIKPEFSMEPKDIDLGVVAKGDVAESQIVLRQLTDEALEVQSVEPWGDIDGLELSYEMVPESQWAQPGYREYVVKAKLSPEVSPGPFMGRFKIQTSLQRMRYITSFVKADVKAFYSINPVNLVLHNQKVDSPRLSGVATISAETPFEVTDLAATNDALKTELRQGSAPNIWEIEVSVDPETQPGSWNEKVTFKIKAGDKIYDERIYVRVLIRRTLPTPPEQAVAPPAIPKPGQLMPPPAPQETGAEATPAPAEPVQ